MSVSTELAQLRAVVAALPPAKAEDPVAQRARMLLTQIVRLLSEPGGRQDGMRA